MKRPLIREVKGLAEYDLDAPEMRFPAHILQGNRLTDDELFKIVTDKFARETSNLSPADIFFFPAEISNQNLDSYYTKMAESSLKNYAEDATNGVSFQNSHKTRDLGVGYVINGEYVETQKKVLADIYTVRGLKLNADLDTDNFIRGVQAGLIRDVSIGFKGGIDYKETCNLCGENYWSYECRHVAGMMYEIADNPNADPSIQNSNEQLAFVWVENARLSEVSAVYDGATPDAMILTKAMREERAGRLSSTMRTELQKRFHIDFHEPGKAFAGSDRRTKEERPLENEEERSDESMKTDLEKAQEALIEAQNARALAETKATEAETKSTAAETRATEAENKLATAEARVTELESAARVQADGIEGIEVTDDSKAEDLMRSVRSTFTETKALADQATELRNAEIDEALKSGVRAYGDDFDQEKKRAFLEKLDLAEIRDTHNDWEARATGTFTGGRKSKDDADDPEDKDGNGTETRSIDQTIPSSAYGVL